jgi:hypothetical protein
VAAARALEVDAMGVQVQFHGGLLR